MPLFSLKLYLFIAATKEEVSTPVAESNPSQSGQEFAAGFSVVEQSDVGEGKELESGGFGTVALGHVPKLILNVIIDPSIRPQVRLSSKSKVGLYDICNIL